MQYFGNFSCQFEQLIYPRGMNPSVFDFDLVCINWTIRAFWDALTEFQAFWFGVELFGVDCDETEACAGLFIDAEWIHRVVVECHQAPPKISSIPLMPFPREEFLALALRLRICEWYARNDRVCIIHSRIGRHLLKLAVYSLFFSKCLRLLVMYRVCLIKFLLWMLCGFARARYQSYWRVLPSNPYPYQ